MAFVFRFIWVYTKNNEIYISKYSNLIQVEVNMIEIYYTKMLKHFINFEFFLLSKHNKCQNNEFCHFLFRSNNKLYFFENFKHGLNITNVSLIGLKIFDLYPIQTFFNSPQILNPTNYSTTRLFGGTIRKIHFISFAF